MYQAVLFDVDGTLVDSNDAHAHAWVEAFAEAGVGVDFGKVRRSIGMGGDKLMPAVSGISENAPDGQRISKRRREIFKTKYLPALRPFAGARDLVEEVMARGMRAVAASSAKRDELERLLQIARASELLDDATSSDDAEESKPDPDIVHAALAKAKAPPADALMIGDTPYDVEAATRADVAVIAFRCGGWSDQDLRGAIAIYDGPWELVAQIDQSPLARQRAKLYCSSARCV
jgi:phosphoglycolate phosphatase-like HAD superfamily hydrolase